MMNQQLNPVGNSGETYSNFATCCCCTSKAHPGNTIQFIKAYFCVNFFFGCAAFCLPGKYSVILACCNLGCAVGGFIMAPNTQQASIVKILVICTLVFNILGVLQVGTVAFFVFIAACFALFFPIDDLIAKIQENGEKLPQEVLD